MARYTRTGTRFSRSRAKVAQYRKMFMGSARGYARRYRGVARKTWTKKSTGISITTILIIAVAGFVAWKSGIFTKNKEK